MPRRRLEDEEDFEQEEEAPRSRLRKLPRKRSFAQLEFEHEQESPTSQHLSALESKIREGIYKPKMSDHWTLHVLYQNLKETKQI